MPYATVLEFKQFRGMLFSQSALLSLWDDHTGCFKVTSQRQEAESRWDRNTDAVQSFLSLVCWPRHRRWKFQTNIAGDKRFSWSRLQKIKYLFSSCRVQNIIFSCLPDDRLCGLVVRVLGYRFGGQSSIPGTTRFSGGKKKENK
jgi:hypothetical protein